MRFAAKQMLWIFLITVFAVALFNTARLGTALWQAWQPDGGGAPPGAQTLSSPGISLAAFDR